MCGCQRQCLGKQRITCEAFPGADTCGGTWTAASDCSDSCWAARPTDRQPSEPEGEGRAPEPVHEAQPRYTSGEADPQGISPERDPSRNAVPFVKGNPPANTRHTSGYHHSVTHRPGAAPRRSSTPHLVATHAGHPAESSSRSLTFPVRHIGAVQLGFFMLSFCHLDSDRPADGPELPIQGANPCLPGVPVSKGNTLFSG